MRPETREDWDAIDAVHQQAFGRSLARRLWCARCGARRSPTSGWSPSRRGAWSGRSTFSPVEIEGGSPPALGLGPLAVEPGLQRAGIGSGLVRAGLARCTELAKIVVVLGHAAYYPRFGFRSASPLGLRYRSEVFDPSFFALELVPGALAGVSGWVRYHEAFERL